MLELATDGGYTMRSGQTARVAQQALERAVVELETAAAALHACGAPRYRDAAELELRRLGRHITRRSNPGDSSGRGVASLSQRERQVADLVVARCTNFEIAAALFLSLHKLSVTLRVEVARNLEAEPQHSMSR